MERAIVGLPASPGIVVGHVHLLRWEVPEVPHRIIADDAIGGEVQRLRDAFEKAKTRLRQIRARAERQAGEQEAAIFDVQVSILEDPTLFAEVEGLIHQNWSAEKAFDVVLLEWRGTFARSSHAMTRGLPRRFAG